MTNTLNPATGNPVSKFTPEFVTLKPSGGDPVTGLSRSWWYNAEKQGLIKLARVRNPGRVKARVLLPVAAAIALVHKLSDSTPEAA